MLEYSTMVLVRAQIVRFVGASHDDGPRFRQKPKDRSRYARFDTMTTEWPGVPVPAEWAVTPEGWELEPAPNGHAVLRCRRLEFTPPQSGIVIGVTWLAEGTIVTDTDPDLPWFKGTAVDRRLVTMYEIAMPPNGSSGRYANRARIILAHELDVVELPGRVGQTVADAATRT